MWHLADRVLAAVHGASRKLAGMEEVENKREVRRIVYSALSIQSNPIISSYISACKHIIMFPHHLMNVCSVFFFPSLLADIFTSSGKQANEIEWYVHNSLVI